MFNKMSIYRCISCSKEFNIQHSKPFFIPCGDIFCEQCVSNIYNSKNKLIKCPLHKKEFIFEFNNFSNYFDTLTNINRYPLEEKDLGLYCIRHNKKRIKYFCELDNNFLCENCLGQHEGHKYSEFKSNKDNFLYEINSLKNNFENLKIKYLNEKSKINQYFLMAKKNLEEQVNKINKYFNNLISVINEKKSQMMIEINHKEKMNLKKLDNIKNIFLISDEKCNFINNEFYYINNELLAKGEYETFYKMKQNFLKLIDNFYIYLNKNIFNNNDLYNNKLINYTLPNNGILEKNKLDIDKEENIYGKIEEITINLNNNKLNAFLMPDIKNNIHINKKEKEKSNKENDNINLSNNNKNNNLDMLLLDKKSILNDGDSYLDNKLIDTGNTFYLINKSNVKNVFKQQEQDQSHNDYFINKDNSNYINKNNSIINNINNINEIRKNYKECKIKDNKAMQRNNNDLNKKKNNDSNKKKAPYKLLNITNNNKEGNKKKEKVKFNKINKTKENNFSTSYLLSLNNNSNIKSEDNRNKIGKEKLCINNKKNNIIKKFYNIQNNNNIIRGNSFNNKYKKDNISYIYASNNNNKSMLSNNLINSYNKEYSKDFSCDLFNKKTNDNKKESQMLTDVNDNNKRIIKSKYSYRDINKRVIIKYDNNILSNNDYRTKRGRSTRQKNSYSEMEILI